MHFLDSQNNLEDSVPFTKSTLAYPLTVALLLQISMPVAFAALPPAADIVQSINKAEFLAPGTSVNVKTVKDQVLVSTYRHSNDENDCKIDAVLISKAVFDLAPNELGRVTCYFFGKDISSCQEVSVSAGDIKAFASGSLDEKQLLASLSVKNIQTESSSDKVARQLESNWIARPQDFKISQDKTLLSISTALDPWVSDEDAKLEALRIAINSHRADPAVQQIKVNFLDPALNAETRELVFQTGSLEETWKSIQSSLAGLTVGRKPPVIDVQSLRTVKGPLQTERDNVLNQLKDMDRKGIGVAPFVKVFVGMEKTVNRNTDTKALWDMLKRLCASIEDQLKAYNAAKEAKSKAAAPKDPEPQAPVSEPKSSGGRWAAGSSPIIPGEVLADPDQVVSRMESEMSRGFAKADDNPRFVLVLEQIASILYKNNRAAQAARYQQRAAEIRARLKK